MPDPAPTAPGRSPPAKVLIVDDEELARDRLRQLLGGDARLAIVGEAGDGGSALEAVARLAPDVVFLDIQMPEVSGLEVAASLDPGEMPVLVFVTAYDEHALRAFDLHAVDYVLKPFDKERFARAVDRALGRHAEKKAAAERPAMLEALRSIKGPEGALADRLVVRSAGRVVFLRPSEVDWIEAAGNYVKLHVGPDEHLVRETMNELHARIDGRTFLRIGRSVVINATRIVEIKPHAHGDQLVVLRDGTELTASRNFKEALLPFKKK